MMLKQRRFAGFLLNLLTAVLILGLCVVQRANRGFVDGTSLSDDANEASEELDDESPGGASQGSANHSAGGGAHSAAGGHGEDANSDRRYQVLSWNWHHVSIAMIVTMWILLACFAKLMFHMSKALVAVFPDSSLLIILGLVVGIILHVVETEKDQFQLNDKVFFLFLLPPIVFDAGYFMPNRAFFDNIGTILVYAVIGTVFNTFTIGLSLWGISKLGIFAPYEVDLVELLLFTSLIAAVDPVAVLVVFEEIHVNEVLYIIVFGESLLNDGVTVVLYHVFETFTELSQILPQDIILAIVSFFVVALGGVLMGLAYSFVVSFATRFTTHVRVLEPLFVFAMAYMSYLTAEMVHLSSILAIVFCGITMKQYVEGNVSQKSQTTIKYFLKMLSVSCETIIFMFLGLSTVSADHGWNTAFVVLTVIFCVVYRSLGVLFFTYFVNKCRLIKMNPVEQVIMAYGGLRGAIAYGLAVAINEHHVRAKPLFVTTTIVVIYFTVFFQGMTIKPLVNFLRIKKKEEHEVTMQGKIFDRMNDHLLTGVEDIMGYHGHHWLRDGYERLNTKYIKRLLMRNPPQTTGMPIVRTFTKLCVKDAVQHAERFGSFHSCNLTTGSLANLIRRHSSQPSVAPGLTSSSTVNQFMANSYLSYSNPCLDMNGVDAPNAGGKKLDGEARLHHLSTQTAKHRSTAVQELREEEHRAHYVDSSDQMQLQDFGSGHHLDILRVPQPRRRYSRHQYDDDSFSSMLHHHTAPYQTRRMIVAEHRPRQTTSGGNGSRRPSGVSTTLTTERNGHLAVADDDTHPRKNVSFSRALPNVPVSYHRNRSQEDRDEFDYITFTVPTEDQQRAVEEPSLTAVEKELPWKRESATPPVLKKGFLSEPPGDCPLTPMPSPGGYAGGDEDLDENDNEAMIHSSSDASSIHSCSPINDDGGRTNKDHHATKGTKYVKSGVRSTRAVANGGLSRFQDTSSAAVAVDLRSADQIFSHSNNAAPRRKVTSISVPNVTTLLSGSWTHCSPVLASTPNDEMTATKSMPFDIANV